MPYEWRETEAGVELSLWPFRSLPRRGFAAMILLAFGLGTVPLYGLLGTGPFWVLLGFILAMVAALWWGLERSYRDGEILEVLVLTSTEVHLQHNPVKGPVLDWRCNSYWVRLQCHETKGPVPYYLTLSGNGRDVEIGRFLSEEERQSLYQELRSKLADLKQPD